MSKIYYDRLKDLYIAGRATEVTITAALNRGWLTQAEYVDILKSKENNTVNSQG